MADMGLSYERLRELKSDVILCSISALGQTGPLAHKPGYDYIAQAYAGVTSMIGDEDEPPYIPLVGLGDVNTGVHGALVVLAALRHRDRTGRGQYLDVALLDVYYHFHEINVPPSPGERREGQAYTCWSSHDLPLSWWRVSCHGGARSNYGVFPPLAGFVSRDGTTGSHRRPAL